MFKQLHIRNKVVPLFSCPEAEDHCPVHIFDQYFCRFFEESFLNDILFILEGSYVTMVLYCFCQQKNSKRLSEKLAKMCTLAGIVGRVTDHSLRATSAIQVYELCVPEKVILEKMDIDH